MAHKDELARLLREMADEIQECQDGCTTGGHLTLLHAELDMIEIRHEDGEEG